MIVYRHPNGDLTVPFSAQGPGGFVGEGLERITSHHADYTAWEATIADGRVEVIEARDNPEAFVIEQHGELGPLLYPPDTKFTGPKDI